MSAADAVEQVTDPAGEHPPARPCEVCEHPRPATFLQVLGGHDVCRWCVPAVLEGMQVHRRASGLGEAAFKRLGKLVSVLEGHCAKLEREGAGEGA